MQDYSMSVPTYWDSDIYGKNAYRAYCNNDDFAMLIIDVDGDMSDFSFENKADRTRFIDAMVTAEDENAKLIESDYRKYGNLQGAFAIFDFVMEGMQFQGTVFAAIDDGYGYGFFLVESPDNKYDYQPDFFKTIGSAQRTVSASKFSSSSQDTLAALSDEAQKAVEDAKAVLNLNSGFSKAMLIEQLSSKYGFGYSVDAATEAVEYLEKTLPIDWNEQAVLRAKAYQDSISISKELLYDVLTSKDGSQFTKEQAEYAFQKLGL